MVSIPEQDSFLGVIFKLILTGILFLMVLGYEPRRLTDAGKVLYD
jgi:hypothetical protein